MIRIITSIIFSFFLLSATPMTLAATNNNSMSGMVMSPNEHVKMVENDMQKMRPMMMNALGEKDKNYDLRFMNLMIMHHEGGIQMAKDALSKSDRPEIKAMAQQIIDSQEKEIEQMKKWKSEWYNQ